MNALARVPLLLSRHMRCAQGLHIKFKPRLGWRPEPLERGWSSKLRN